MTAGAIFWVVVFGVSAFLFFAVALVVMVRGMGDLRELLRGSVRGRRER
jgi:hypothetical protein